MDFASCAAEVAGDNPLSASFCDPGAGGGDAGLARKLGQLQAFIAVFSQECVGQLACFLGQPNTFLLAAGERQIDRVYL